ncbi:MAG TPA: hypothetical protein VES65_02110 [Solirubrobacteraceae bacterium]|nr:hypothetical protein [Solirubrobacteraceae bacterium]
MDVYAQLEQRVKRSHGKSFDRLVRRAREQVAGLALVPSNADSTEQEPAIGPRLGHEDQNRTKTTSTAAKRPNTKSHDLQRVRRMARLGIEPRTPRFLVDPEDEDQDYYLQ